MRMPFRMLVTFILFPFCNFHNIFVPNIGIRGHGWVILLGRRCIALMSPYALPFYTYLLAIEKLKKKSLIACCNIFIWFSWNLHLMSTGWSIWSDSWVGLTSILFVPPSASFCLGKLAEVAEQLGQMVEHYKSKSTQPTIRPDGPPCIIRNLLYFVICLRGSGTFVENTCLTFV